MTEDGWIGRACLNVRQKFPDPQSQVKLCISGEGCVFLFVLFVCFMIIIVLGGGEGGVSEIVRVCVHVKKSTARKQTLRNV